MTEYDIDVNGPTYHAARWFCNASAKNKAQFFAEILIHYQTRKQWCEVAEAIADYPMVLFWLSELHMTAQAIARERERR